MNRRTCPDCGGRSYSSSDKGKWDCPYCGKDMSEVCNDQNLWANLTNALEEKTQELIDLLPKA
ncbi:hypothetical protein ACPUYX_00745 [Desulfosporosinus sp. SYSU MS00001]|uniref:hypothetical protein n=1 Tax=Desulfosporosinus sp. SYSU MS00001 TaxID=3416284 RepID=UPI003CE9A775